MKNLTSLILIAFFALSSCAQMSTPQTTAGNTSAKAPAPPPATPTKSSKISSSTQSSGTTKSTKTTSSTTTSSSGGGLLGGNDEMIAGLKEALSLGATNSASKLSITDAFFKNTAIKILMPPEAKDVEAKLRQLGMGNYVDEAILSMNRAAEMAAKDAGPIFLDAIKSMSFADAMSIVTGPNDGATQYLKKTTSPQLTTKFKPVIQTALEKTNATKYWNDVFSNYNKLPFVKKINPDLTAYVTQKALEGLFFTLAGEEAKIRKDPIATGSSIIAKVFGKH